MKKRTAKKVVSALLMQTRRSQRWSLELECGHLIWRPAVGATEKTKPPSRVNHCEKCFSDEVFAGFKAARV